MKRPRFAPSRRALSILGWLVTAAIVVSLVWGFGVILKLSQHDREQQDRIEASIADRADLRQILSEQDRALNEANRRLRKSGGTPVSKPTEPATDPLIPTDGADGKDGRDGRPGARGRPGAPGTDGADGSAGTDGSDGEPGAAATGAPGEPGLNGATGPAGEVGATGAQGEPGPAGPKGEPGAVGPQGEVGPAGPTGPSGTVPDSTAGCPPGEYVTGVSLTGGSLSVVCAPLPALLPEPQR